ncbi:hypothetical protein XENOCAPTIV_007241 [Xenoophorus captivus]|uniref:Uncharacterized protein n=1 Tax=Xenoophorus captivus TaxID=1517983 RepID=A0ABV0QRK1_9TELE
MAELLTISQRESHPAEETHFSCLYVGSCSSGHDPKFIFIGEGRNIDRLVNRELCLSAQLFLYHNGLEADQATKPKRKICVKPYQSKSYLATLKKSLETQSYAKNNVTKLKHTIQRKQFNTSSLLKPCLSGNDRWR